MSNCLVFTFTNILVLFVVSLLTIKGVKRKVQNQRRARPNIRTAYLDNESKNCKKHKQKLKWCYIYSVEPFKQIHTKDLVLCCKLHIQWAIANFFLWHYVLFAKHFFKWHDRKWKKPRTYRSFQFSERDKIKL